MSESKSRRIKRNFSTPPKVPAALVGQDTPKIAVKKLVENVTLPGIKVTLLVFAGPPPTGGGGVMVVGKLVVMVTVVNTFERICALQKFVGRMKKVPKSPFCDVIFTVVLVTGGVPAGANGELVRVKVTVPTNPWVAKVLVTKLAKVC